MMSCKWAFLHIYPQFTGDKPEDKAKRAEAQAANFKPKGMKCFSNKEEREKNDGQKDE